MNKELRKQVVLSMETLARCINDEDIFDTWLMVGVADGDIKKFDTSEVDECYIEDETFKRLLGCFVRMMKKAEKIGGLYVDKVVSD